jgi:hypothetical protein
MQCRTQVAASTVYEKRWMSEPGNSSSLEGVENQSDPVAVALELGDTSLYLRRVEAQCCLRRGG